MAMAMARRACVVGLYCTVVVVVTVVELRHNDCSMGNLRWHVKMVHALSLYPHPYPPPPLLNFIPPLVFFEYFRGLVWDDSNAGVLCSSEAAFLGISTGLVRFCGQWHSTADVGGARQSVPPAGAARGAGSGGGVT